MNTSLTLGQSAKLTGKSKTTIHNAVKSGKVSGRKGSNGEYQIDPAELSRVYPAVTPAGEHQNGPVDPQTERDVTPQMNRFTGELDALKLVIEQLETRIDEKDERIGEIKTQLAQSQNLLTDQRSDAEKARAALDDERKKPTLKVRQRRLTLKERLFGGLVPEVEKHAS